MMQRIKCKSRVDRARSRSEFVYQEHLQGLNALLSKITQIGFTKRPSLAMKVTNGMLDSWWEGSRSFFKFLSIGCIIFLS